MLTASLEPQVASVESEQLVQKSSLVISCIWMVEDHSPPHKRNGISRNDVKMRLLYSICRSNESALSLAQIIVQLIRNK